MELTKPSTTLALILLTAAFASWTGIGSGFCADRKRPSSPDPLHGGQVNPDPSQLPGRSRPVYARTISFSGYEWDVRDSPDPANPDSNYFSDSLENVWVDSSGRLHLRITERSSRWYCSEVILRRSLGHGQYIFQLESDLAELDRNVVLGLFHYDYTDLYPFHREMDIEFSRWGIPGSPNAQYVIQPWETGGNLYRWTVDGGLDSTTHAYYWTTDSVCFTSAEGHESGTPFQSVLAEWTYRETASVPQPGGERVRLNLWLSLAWAPSDSSQPEVVVKSFEHQPETRIRRRPGPHLPSHRLFQNQPNPFVKETVARYELKSAERVCIGIFDAAGSRVKTLFDGDRMPGAYEVVWDGTDESGRRKGSGVYLCRMEAGPTVVATRMILLD